MIWFVFWNHGLKLYSKLRHIVEILKTAKVSIWVGHEPPSFGFIPNALTAWAALLNYGYMRLMKEKLRDVVIIWPVWYVVLKWCAINYHLIGMEIMYWLRLWSQSKCTWEPSSSNNLLRFTVKLVIGILWTAEVVGPTMCLFQCIYHDNVCGMTDMISYPK